eukprot:scaffold13626_cov110-Isochrysis_galbana.AAC.7
MTSRHHSRRPRLHRLRGSLTRSSRNALDPGHEEIKHCQSRRSTAWTSAKRPMLKRKFSTESRGWALCTAATSPSARLPPLPSETAKSTARSRQCRALDSRSSRRIH